MKKRFIYANGRVSALETTLLDDRMWQMLVSAKDEEEALHLLGDTWYGKFMHHHTLRECFMHAGSSVEDELLELSESKELVRGILHRRDVRNARYIWKNLIVGGQSDAAVDTERRGLIPLDVLERAAGEPEAMAELPPIFRRTLERLLEADVISVQIIDMAMDRLAAEVELEELPALEPCFRHFLKIKIEQKNFLTAGRLKMANTPVGDVEEMLLDGGFHRKDEIACAYRKNILPEMLAEVPGLEGPAAAYGEALSGEGFSVFERECDRRLLQLLEKGAFPVFGPTPLAAFILRTELEINHLKILVAAKVAGIDRQRLQSRVPRG